ncbi:MAG TPA: C25 family cysteine peptidase [Polyangia bacterium]|nr:C25 family cysteine peptidase [Polyangia bacterium]
MIRRIIHSRCDRACLAGVAFATVALLGAGGARGATAQDEQFALAGAGAVKIVVRGDGWVHVGPPALATAGLPSNVDPSKLQLFADGVEQAIEVNGDGSIEFYGTGRDTLWTDAHTYWLVAGAAGARVPLQAPAAGGAAPANFVHAERLVDHKMYLSAVLNGDKTNFFAAAVSSTPTNETLSAPNLDASAAGSATLSVSLQGVTATTHAVDVSFNGQFLGTCTLGATAEGTFTFATPNVVEGDNHVSLTSEGTSDYTALESLELDYGHTYAADGDALWLTAPASTRVAITGFGAAGVRVVDVTDPTHPIELTVTTPVAGTARVDTPAATGPRSLYAFTPANVAAAASVAADAPSSWATSHDGDLLILSHASFMDAMAPLVARRAQEGWSVQLVDLQDVYDEFGGGDKTIVAIRDFVQWTRTHWRVPPRFVLLVGDATFDPRNFLGLGDFDFAPTKLIDTSTMETASDDWYVDADLDGVPEIAIGRMPVRTADQATTVVAKTLAYAGKAALPNGGLFVTDQNDPDVDFEAASAASEAEVTGIMPTTRFPRSDPASTSDALMAKLDAGPFLVNYFGHGSVEVWDDLLTSAQATTLTNTSSSIYVVMNCLNGFFQDLYTTSLAESLLEAPHGGAVAVWASSTLADFTPQPELNQEFLMHLTHTSLGEGADDAKQSITDLETRRTWLLFGDPTLFGTPLPPPDAGAGPGDAGVPAMDAAAERADATGADGGVAMDAATGAADASFDASSDASADASSIVADAAAPDASDGAAKADAAGTSDASSDAGGGNRPPPTGAGCGCSLDAKSSGAPTGVGLLALACVAARRGRRRTREPRRSRWPLGLLALAVTWLAWTPGARAAYTYRKALTIDRTRIGNTGGATTLTNYPLLISTTDASLKSAANGGHVQSANGYDIAFTGADTTTCGGPATCTFKYEIEQYVATTGQIVAWVQIPTLKTTANTANTIIYIQYGDATISSPTQNVNGTWDTSFKGVWHLNQSPVTTQTDSTSTAANATSTGTPAPATATGLISGGVSTSSTTGAGYFDLSTSTAFNYLAADAFTYSGWFNTADTSGPLLSQRDAGGKPVIDINIGYDGLTSSPGKLTVLFRDDGNNAPGEVVGTTTVSDGAWHFFAVTRSGATLQVYLDGASIGINAGASTSTITTTLRDIGREGNWVAASYGTTDQQYLAATFDEYRISKTLRTSDWIVTDYNTQKTPASTFSASGEATTACGNGTLDAGEACDDGNLLSGDGCSTVCTIEAGYTCNNMVAPSVCTTTCGDGITAGTESCDDGNLTNGDGCSSTCTVESGYHCNTAPDPSVCAPGKFEVSKAIVINKAKVGTASSPTTLSDYPILFSVVDPSLRSKANGGRLYTTTATTAYDLQFRGEDVVTCNGASSCQLAHEIESYNSSTGAMVAWVRIPTLRTQTNTSSTTIQLYLGNQAITTTTEQINATWNSGFTSVWHLNQSPTTSMTDSTSNGNTGTGTALTSTTGQMGSGVSTDGSTSYMAFNSGTSLNVASGAGFTWSAWVKTTATFGPILSLRQAASGNPVIDIMVGYDGNTLSSGSLLGLVRDSGGTLGEVNGGTTIGNGAFHLVTVTRSGSSLTMYLDATQFTPMTTGTNTIPSDIRNMGREGYWQTTPPGVTGHSFLAATFDEVRASNTARSIDWVTTDYNAQSSPSTFITYTLDTPGETAVTIHTDVEILSFDATDQCAGTKLAWQTADEIDTLGFNVYRDVGGVRAPLNPTLIPGGSLSGGGGHSYDLVDPGSQDAGRTYLLEQVDFDLTSHWYGPVSPAAPAAGACASGATTPRAPSTSIVSAPSGAPTPSVTSAADAQAADQLGGCSVGTRGGGGVAALLVVSMLALARRRRRR